MATLAYHNQYDSAYPLAAYAPIVYRIYLDYPAGSAMPTLSPIVFLDIYFGGVYYKTLSKSVYELQAVTYGSGASLTIQQRPFWIFDVADAVQEYLQSSPLPTYDSDFTEDVTAVATLQVKARASNFDANGFITPETPVPVQGNFYTAPVGGGGINSNAMRVLNAVLRIEDNPDLYTHLLEYKDYSSPGFTVLPLTHRVSGAYYACTGQSDRFSVFIPNSGLNGTDPLDCVFGIGGKYKNGTSFIKVAQSIPFTLYEGGVFHIPSGPQQLVEYIWSGGAIDWPQVASYALGLFNGSNQVWQSGLILCDCACTNGARIHFLNALGTFDAVNFCERTEVQETKSSTWQQSVPLVGATKRDGGNRRFGARSTRQVTMRSAAYPESAQLWLTELARSTQVYLEWTGTQGQPDNLLPVRVLDGKIVSRKSDERYVYELELTVEMSNDILSQRN